jgi:hypothetical protein
MLQTKKEGIIDKAADRVICYFSQSINGQVTRSRWSETSTVPCGPAWMV